MRLALHAYAAVLASVSTAAFAQDAVQWRVEDGGNGHWYMAVVGDYQDAWINWYEAQDASMSIGGHLATVATALEDAFVGATLGNKDLWLGGMSSTGNGCDLSSWRWLDGSEWDYMNWAPGEPAQCRDGLAYNSSGGYTGQWNDYPRTSPLHGYIVEWSADCNDDGIVDYGQILDGTFEDIDGNGIPDCCDQGTACGCRVDLNGDDLIDTQDFLVYLNLWVQRDPIADWDGNDEINSHDFLVFLNDWNQGC